MSHVLGCDIYAIIENFLPLVLVIIIFQVLLLYGELASKIREICRYLNIHVRGFFGILLRSLLWVITIFLHALMLNYLLKNMSTPQIILFGILIGIAKCEIVIYYELVERPLLINNHDNAVVV